ncbi:MAG: Hint domain-containing protein [Paracoccaceae bacterium]
MTRRYELAWLAADDNVETATHVAPAIAEFEEAFSAFARGTVIATTDGPVAVEDLVPGMEAVTGDTTAERIMWIGSMSVFPARPGTRIETATMTRITADAFGMGRPTPDLLLGPWARIMLRDARCRAATGASAAYAPAKAFMDGVSIIEVTPIAPVTAFHVVLERQGSIRAAGLELESYHPGHNLSERLDPQLATMFMSLFPHLRSAGEFGPLAHPRLTGPEVEAALLG